MTLSAMHGTLRWRRLCRKPSRTSLPSWVALATRRACHTSVSQLSILQLADKVANKLLGKPAVLAGGVAAGSTGVKAAEHKDVEHKDTKVPEVPAKEEVETPTTDAVTPRTGSGDEDDSVPKKSKSRSVSRGKRASIFGSMLGKKDEVDAKKDLKKDDKIQTEDAKALDTLESKPEVNEAVEAKSVESTAFDAQAIGKPT